VAGDGGVAGVAGAGVAGEAGDDVGAGERGVSGEDAGRSTDVREDPEESAPVRWPDDPEVAGRSAEKVPRSELGVCGEPALTGVTAVSGESVWAACRAAFSRAVFGLTGLAAGTDSVAC
jgi:hypothetical protein